MNRRARRPWAVLALAAGLGAAATPAAAAVWKAAVEIGLVSVYAEMNDAEAPVVVFIRVENHSKLASVPISRYFVQLTDGRGQPVKAVTADDLVSDRLDRLRLLLPDSLPEIDALVGEIQADYPQEKLISVYARLKQFLAAGRPKGWRTRVENFLLGTRAATETDRQAAVQAVEEIGEIARSYLWARDVAPAAVYTGVVYFQRPSRDPVSIFFELDKQFIGAPLVQAAGDAKSAPKK